MDVLTDVLQTTKIQGSILSDCRYVAPWGIAMAGGKLAGFHLVLEGACYLRAPRRAPVPLLQGDLVLVPSGASHEIADAPDTRCVSVDDVIAGKVRWAKHGPTARLVCGAYRFEGRSRNPLFGLLPPFLHLRAGEVARSEALHASVRLLVGELEQRSLGHAALVDRLVDALFVYVVRAWLAEQPAGAGGWLGALRDEQIGRSIALMHGEPSREWSVEQLAREVGLSRAAFARRFTALVGAPPLAYLTRWRVDLAAQQLRGTYRPLSAIASEVGYASEFAFSRAFKRVTGKPPSAFRAAAEL